MKLFDGFPHNSQATPIPEAFFAEVLPEIDDIAELKDVLMALHRVRKMKGHVRYVTASELRAAPELARGLGTQEEREAALGQALASAVARRVLLTVLLAEGHKEETAYFINDVEGRRAVELVRTGAVSLGLPPTPEPPMLQEQPNIFVLYENIIGRLLSGVQLAEELRQAEQDYPYEWIQDAFKEAAHQNKRSWTYVRAILRKWDEEGRSDGKSGRRSEEGKYTSGRYGRVVRY